MKMRKAFSTASHELITTPSVAVNAVASSRLRGRLQRQACIRESTSAECDSDWIGVAPLLNMSGTAKVLACKAATISSAMLASHKCSSLAGSASFVGGGGGAISCAASMSSFGGGGGAAATLPPSVASVVATAQIVSADRQSTSQPAVIAPNAGSIVANSRVQAARESVAVFAEILSMDAATMAANKQRITEDLVCMGLFEFVLKLSCIFSMVSVCLHTPDTIHVFPSLEYILFVIDLMVTMFFTLEALLKTNRQTMRDRWFQFDLVMLLFHYLSVTLHAYELLVTRWAPGLGLTYQHWYGVVRSPRPFIMIRLIRSVIRFKLPKNRIKQIIKRSSQQIQNVTIFFLFFMALYAIMGVQLFGRMEYHCVVFGTDPSNVTINDLAIPDTMCSQKGQGGYECPDNMQCMRLELNAKQKGLYGMFNDFGRSLFTVYLAASEEGWVYVLYECLDSFPSYVAFFYFVTLVFFLAWLVKNVFIAVITETFAEFRVQFSEMWQAREFTSDDGIHKMKLERCTGDDGDHLYAGDACGGDQWTLVAVNDERQDDRAPQLLKEFVRSTSFHISMMVMVLLNALINASFVYRHDETDAVRKRIYYFIEVAFTVLFNVECVVKISGLRWSGYIRRGQHKFELVLCVGSTLNVVPTLYESNVFTYFQVFRILRLIKASPMLEDFVYKIFGPGKKLGGLVFFTLILLIITSAISLQLFCHVHELEKFRTFPRALMSMFQIITQEGWTDEVVEILRAVSDPMVPFAMIYFVGYHLFVTLILLSLFVAVILDNLEMDEELKKVKQLKAREQTTSMRTTLPWRLRIFEKFPTRPQMVQLRKVNSDFPMPKVRDSFTRQFFDSEMADAYFGGGIPYVGDFATKRLLKCQPHLRSDLYRLRVRQNGQLSSKYGVYCLIEESNRNRMLLSDSTQIISVSHHHNAANHVAVANGGGGGSGSNNNSTTMRRNNGGGSGRQEHIRHRKRAFSNGNSSSLKVKAIYEHFKENGDVRGGAVHHHGGGTDSAAAYSSTRKELRYDDIDIKAIQQKRAQAEFTRNRIEEEMRENHPLFDRPLFAVGRDSRLRRVCRRIVDAKYTPIGVDPVSGKIVQPQQRRYKQLHSLLGLMTYLDWSGVVVTICSCSSMLFESPWPPSTGEWLIFNNIYLQICEYIFVLAMTFELAVRVIANGLFFTPRAVVGDVGGVMTLFIYVTSVWHLLWMPRHIEINSLAQLLMIFRAMRPLRIYTLVPHIRRVVVELCKGFKDILLVTILLVLLIFIFASFGVQIAGGKLAGCNDPTVKNRENCTSVFEQKIFVTRMEVYGKNDDNLHPKILVPRVWTNPRNFNFDHIGNAMLALFETLSYKGWNVIRDILWDRKGPWAVIFIHIYVFIGCMIGVTLFIGVVVANYMENSGTALLTVDQRRWNDLKARLRMAQPLHVPPKPSESARLRNRLYVLTTSRPFKQFYAALVVINSATLVVPWNVEEESDRRVFLYVSTLLSALCNALFAVEIVLKSIAFTFRGFWESKRNRIDLLITALGGVWIVMHFVMALPASVVNAANRLKRFTYTFGYIVVIMRFFTIAGRKSTLKMLMLTVVMGMVRSCFIIAAMFLLVLFYAYAGVVLFGMVKYGQAVSKHVNFRTGKEALVVLFRSVTGEDWNDIMHDCMRSPPFCYWKEGMSYYETDCGNYFGAIIYFCSFYLIIAYIVLNLLVAIIMENFSLFYSSEEDALLSYADIRNYQQVWNMIDIEQKHTIPTRRVKFLLRLLKGRLEVDPNKDRLLFKHMCHEMERLNNGEDVSFHDILSMLSYRSVDIRKSLQWEELLQREELEYTIEEEVAKQTIRSWLETCLRRIKQEQKLHQERSFFLQGRLSTPMVNTSAALENLIMTSTTNVAIANNNPSQQPLSSASQMLSASPSIITMTMTPSGTMPIMAVTSDEFQQRSPPSLKTLVTEEDGGGKPLPSAGPSQSSGLPSQQGLPTTAASTTATTSMTSKWTARAIERRNFAVKKVKSLRRNSIPELVGEAKKLVWGSRMKSLPTSCITPPPAQTTTVHHRHTSVIASSSVSTPAPLLRQQQQRRQSVNLQPDRPNLPPVLGRHSPVPFHSSSQIRFLNSEDGGGGPQLRMRSSASTPPGAPFKCHPHICAASSTSQSVPLAASIAIGGVSGSMHHLSETSSSHGGVYNYCELPDVEEWDGEDDHTTGTSTSGDDATHSSTDDDNVSTASTLSSSARHHRRTGRRRKRKSVEASTVIREEDTEEIGVGGGSAALPLPNTNAFVRNRRLSSSLKRYDATNINDNDVISDIAVRCAALSSMPSLVNASGASDDGDSGGIVSSMQQQLKSGRHRHRNRLPVDKLPLAASSGSTDQPPPIPPFFAASHHHPATNIAACIDEIRDWWKEEVTTATAAPALNTLANNNNSTFY